MLLDRLGDCIIVFVVLLLSKYRFLLSFTPGERFHPIPNGLNVIVKSSSLLKFNRELWGDTTVESSPLKTIDGILYVVCCWKVTFLYSISLNKKLSSNNPFLE